MDINLGWEKLPAQEICYDDDITKTIHFSGGLGSGKTYFLCRKAIKLSVLNYGFAGGILVPAYSDFKRDVEPTFDDIFNDLGLEENIHYWYHKTDKTYRFIWNKKPLYIFTGEKPIAGPNLAYCLVNEFSLIKYDRIREMLRRVRVQGAPVRQRVLAGTPEDIYGWLDEFVEGQQKKEEKYPNSYKLVFADTRENTHIDPDYRAHLESMLDAQSLKVFASGQMVRLGGTYFYYAFLREKNLGNVKYNKNDLVYVGLDFNVGKMAASFSHKVFNEKTSRNEQHFFDELLLESAGNDYADTKKMAIAIKSRYGVDNVIITCDASGNSRKTSGVSDVQMLESFGFKVRFSRSNPRLRDRQLLVNGLLDHGSIIINPECKILIRDLEKVQQNKSDFTKVKDSDDRLTHMSDGMDYLLDWEYQTTIRRTRTIRA